jgi:hypothetical protein
MPVQPELVANCVTVAVRGLAGEGAPFEQPHEARGGMNAAT